MFLNRLFLFGFHFKNFLHFQRGSGRAVSCGGVLTCVNTVGVLHGVNIVPIYKALRHDMLTRF